MGGGKIKEDIKTILHTYFIINDSHKITLDIFREYILRSTGVNLISYNNFLNLSEEVIKDHEKRITKLKERKG